MSDSQRLSLVSVMVDDLGKAVEFYGRALGWDAVEVLDDVAFYRMNGFVASLWSREGWAGEELDVPAPSHTVVSINFTAEQEVDAAIKKFVDAGGRLVKTPEKVFWGGYSGYVEDPWKNLIEFSVNPFWEVTEQGHTVIPQT